MKTEVSNDIAKSINSHIKIEEEIKCYNLSLIIIKRYFPNWFAIHELHNISYCQGNRK